jgi:hypothetical protein
MRLGRDGELIRAGAAVGPPRNLRAWEHKRTRDLALVYYACSACASVSANVSNEVGVVLSGIAGQYRRALAGRARKLFDGSPERPHLLTRPKEQLRRPPTRPLAPMTAIMENPPAHRDASRALRTTSDYSRSASLAREPIGSRAQRRHAVTIGTCLVR